MCHPFLTRLPHPLSCSLLPRTTQLPRVESPLRTRGDSDLQTRSPQHARKAATRRSVMVLRDAPAPPAAPAAGSEPIHWTELLREPASPPHSATSSRCSSRQGSRIGLGSDDDEEEAEEGDQVVKAVAVAKEEEQKGKGKAELRESPKSVRSVEAAESSEAAPRSQGGKRLGGVISSLKKLPIIRALV